MKLLTVPPRQGALWARKGIEAFSRAPLAFCLLMVATVLLALVLAPMRMVGMALTLAAPPLVSLGFMIATRRVLEGNRRPTPMVFIEPFRAGRAKVVSLLKLCAAYATLFVTIIMVCNWISGDRFGKLAPSPDSSVDVMTVIAGDPALMWSLLLCMTLLALLSLAFWHAPALIYWGGQGMSHSVFSSTLGCWRNRGAFTIYGLVWIAVNMVVSWLMVLVMLFLGNATLTAAVMLAAGLLLSAMFYASLYFTFVGSFGEIEGSPGPRVT